MYCDRVIAHRGGPARAPENTLAAFRRAAADGARWVETDVCLLGDGTPVLFHDADFRRLAGRPARVRETGWATVRDITVGGEPVPRLADALPELDALGLGLNLELKLHGDERAPLVDAVLPVLDAHWPHARRLLVSSFDPEALAMVRARRADMALGLICGEIPADWRARLAALEAVSLHPDHRTADPATIADVAAAGYDTYTYTPNTAAAVADLWAAGLTGVITDDLAAFSDLLPAPADSPP